MKKKFESPKIDVKKIQIANLMTVSCQGDHGCPLNVSCNDNYAPSCNPDFGQ